MVKQQREHYHGKRNRSSKGQRDLCWRQGKVTETNEADLKRDPEDEVRMVMTHAVAAEQKSIGPHDGSETENWEQLEV